MRTTICTLFMLSLLAGFASCSSDDFTDGPLASGDTDSESLIQHITVTLPSIEDEDGTADTRSTFTNVDSGNFNAVWSEGDTLGIFPSSGGQVEFAIKSFGTNSANFDGGGWGLKNAETYAAYYPFSKQNVYATNKTIPLDYTGQVQRGNGSHSHLGAKDYLASAAVKRSGDGLNFSMLRQGALVGLTLTVPATDTYTEIELVTDGTPFVTKANLDISSTSAPSVSAVERSNVLRLKLEDVTVSANGTLKAYMMIFPDGTVTPRVILHGKKGTYEGVVPKQMALTRNKNYARTITSFTRAKIKNLNLIAAAEANEDVDFTEFKDDDGYVDVNTARAMLEKVKKIEVKSKYDPTVCDEIGYFPNLEELNCYRNNILSLDVSKNTKLKVLVCQNNKLTSLDLTNNPFLTELDCSFNQLTSLNVKENPQLIKLLCSVNKLASLDISYNPVLKTLYCYSNQLTSLDLAYNPSLETLYCYNNTSLTSLDISNNRKLKYLHCYKAALTKLDVSANIILEWLDCNENQLTSLDVSKNTALERLQCGKNQLTSLDVSMNTALTSLICNDTKIYTLNTSHLKNLTFLNVSNCSSLTTLNCDGQDGNPGVLSTLNVSGCTNLTGLNCSRNKLANLDVSTLTRLTILRCNDNLIKTLDVSNNTKLYQLYCNDNLMTTLDITKCTTLKLNGRIGSNFSYVYCGRQWTTSAKTTNIGLTLTYNPANNTGALQDLTTANYLVTLKSVSN